MGQHLPHSILDGTFLWETLNAYSKDLPAHPDLPKDGKQELESFYFLVSCANLSDFFLLSSHSSDEEAG